MYVEEKLDGDYQKLKCDYGSCKKSPETYLCGDKTSGVYSSSNFLSNNTFSIKFLKKLIFPGAHYNT